MDARERKRFGLMLGLAVWLLSVNAAAAAPPDAVELLREVLARREDPINAPKAVLDFRRKLLHQRIEALRTIRDLRRALALTEWDDSVRLLDDEMRLQVGGRLKKAISKVIAEGDATSRLAIANMLAETGPGVRALHEFDLRGFAASMVDDVIKLTRDPSPAVRQEAIRALGTINADPAKATPVLEQILKHGAANEKRVAAFALGQMVRVVNHLLNTGQGKFGIGATDEDFIRTATYVVNAVPAGFIDPDGEVRQLAYEAIDTAAYNLGDMILKPFDEARFPPYGREFSKDERDFMLAAEEEVKIELLAMAPVLKALAARGDGMAKGLGDADCRVRITAATALENIAYTRDQFLRRIYSIPDPAAKLKNGGLAPDHWAAEAFVDPLAQFIKSDLGAVITLLNETGDPRLRRVAVDFLERIGVAAAPAIEALARRLADEDRFVRWAAARTLSDVIPEIVSNPTNLTLVVNGLANMLCDYDAEVRMAAAETLENIGPPALQALAAVNEAIVKGDAEPRVAAMNVLSSIGLTKAAAPVAECSIKALVFSLTPKATPDERVRRAAAQALGVVVPQLPGELTAAREAAVTALRAAIGDDDAEVRTYASDALLVILQGPVD